MSRSLSILLPVYNAQSHLEQTVVSLLDVVPELTSDFEVLIIDNGSSDDTADAAQSLVARFPQLQLMQNQRRLGWQTVIGSGLAVARGDVVFLREDGTSLDLNHISSLWRRMGRRHFVQLRGTLVAASAVAQGAARTSAPNSWDRAVARSGQSAVTAAPAKATAPGLKMFLRSIGRELPWSINEPDAFLAEVAARGYDSEELQIGHGSTNPIQAQPVIVADSAHAAGKPKPRRPNYLARILALTSGN